MAQGEIGASGLNRTQQGSVDEEFLPNLQGRKALNVFQEMSENDPLVGAILYAIDMLCRGVDWDVEEHPDGTEEDAEFIRECMQDMSHTWADHISEVLSMLRYGWSWFEVVYKKRSGYQPETSKVPTSRFDDGKIGWRKFAIRAQSSLDRWDFDEGGGIRGMVQKPPPDYQELNIPMQKSLLFRTTTAKGSPEGRSVLRNAYRPWYYKNQIEMSEAHGIERDLAGMPFAKVPARLFDPNASDEEKALFDAIQKIVRNVKRNKEEGIIWPLEVDEQGGEQYTFELLSSGGSRTFDTSAIIQRYDQRIAMVVLADFILLGHEKVGSFALSSDKTDLFAVAIGAYLDMIQEVYNRFAIPRLMTLNGMDVTKAPKIVHKDIESPPIADLATYVSTLVSAGVPMFPDEQLEKHLREIASLPEKSEEAKDDQDEKAALKDLTEGGDEPTEDTEETDDADEGA